MLKTVHIKKLACRFFSAAAFLLFMTSQALALNLISDEETETLIKNIAAPVFKAAHIPYNSNKVFIVNDDTLNAFVSDGNYLFINTGTIIAADDAEELRGVIAHEIGHISGGHIITQKIKAQEMQKVSLASFILAGGAAAASGNGDVAMAVALGGQSSLLTNYLRYRTEQERSADESAVAFLNQTQTSPAGLLRFMKKIVQENELSGIEESPYFRTHPINSERIKFLQKAVTASPYSTSKIFQSDFERVKAKLVAFLSEPQETFRKYPLSNTSVAAQYAQAIAFFKLLDIQNALQICNNLIAKEPNNPFFKEIKAQILMETGNVAAAQKEYKNALELLPNSASLQLSYAQAVLENTPSPQELKNVIALLNKANLKQPLAINWMLLSKAYALNQEQAYSLYAAAQYSFLIGEEEVSERQLKQAKEMAKSNPALILKIDDLAAKIKQNKKKNSY